LQDRPNALDGLLPSYSRYRKVVKVLPCPESGVIRLMADVVSQELVYFGE
jgi:hypothetical protein